VSALPLLVSLPHAGLEVPPELEPYNALPLEEIVRDGDEGAAEIYAISEHVHRFVTTGVARAFVDQNRAPDDRRKDGVVKTHTCWDVPVYRESLPETLVRDLLARYHAPYHERLERELRSGVRLAVDCHTMAAEAPPVAPDPGRERPAVCLGNGGGATAPDELLDSLARCFEEAFGREVRRNDPFGGGYIVRRHAGRVPWIQIELSRAPFAPNAEKRRAVLEALRAWCARV